jgi:hypothetical protein
MLAALEACDSVAIRRILTEHPLHKRDTVVELLRNGEICSSSPT